MVRYEETYCKLLTGEYTGSKSVIKMALDYVINQIKIHRDILKECYFECIADDYFKYINAILIYRNGIHLSQQRN